MLIHVCLMLLIFSDPNILPNEVAGDPNDPAAYCHGYLEMLCAKWMERPVVEYYRGPPNVHVPGKVHLTVSNGTPETVLKTVRLDVMDLGAFARYAEKHPGGLKSRPRPPSAPHKLTIAELAMFAEILFMTETGI